MPVELTLQNTVLPMLSVCHITTLAYKGMMARASRQKKFGIVACHSLFLRSRRNLVSFSVIPFTPQSTLASL